MDDVANPSTTKLQTGLLGETRTLRAPLPGTAAAAGPFPQRCSPRLPRSKTCTQQAQSQPALPVSTSNPPPNGQFPLLFGAAAHRWQRSRADRVRFRVNVGENWSPAAPSAAYARPQSSGLKVFSLVLGGFTAPHIKHIGLGSSAAYARLQSSGLRESGAFRPKPLIPVSFT